MIELQGDLWKIIPADAKVITTNGYVKTNGEAVMGRGVAQQAALRWRELPRTLGEILSASGNHVASLGRFSYDPTAEERDKIHTNLRLPTQETFELIAMPVKHLWSQPADLDLILRSRDELLSLVHYKGWQKVVLPRPGCGNGGLSWEVVRPIMANVLDNRFVIVQL